MRPCLCLRPACDHANDPHPAVHATHYCIRPCIRHTIAYGRAHYLPPPLSPAAILATHHCPQQSPSLTYSTTPPPMAPWLQSSTTSLSIHISPASIKVMTTVPAPKHSCMQTQVSSTVAHNHRFPAWSQVATTVIHKHTSQTRSHAIATPLIRNINFQSPGFDHR